MRHIRTALLGLAIAAPLAQAQADTITLNVAYRDFLTNGTPSGTYGGFSGVGHVDFENGLGAATGMVASSLSGGVPVFTAANGTGAVANAASFAQWFTDVAGVNARVNSTLTLNNIGGTTYNYSSNSFFPVDGQGFNSSGFQTAFGHNFAFTMQMSWTGSITNTSQAFSFSGDDDLWVFANGNLFMDLGGVHGTMSASATGAQILAAAGASLNQSIRFDLFFAERHTTGSNFTMTTDMAQITAEPLVTNTPEPASLALLATGLATIAVRRRRRV